MRRSIHHIVFSAGLFLVLMAGNSLSAQHLENRTNGTVRNKGVIRFHSDSGTFKNGAPVTEFSNNVVEFRGTDNRFTDLNGAAGVSTAFGQDRAWRVPGLVRYVRDSGQQNLQARYYSDLEVADSAGKLVPDSVFVGGSYVITESGPRSYLGTFFYDGTTPQIITQERGVTGPFDRYNNLTLLFSTKTVRDSDEVRMDGIFNSDAMSELIVEGQFTWGTSSFSRAPIRIRNKGLLTTGTSISELYADLDVLDGDLVVPDDSDTVKVMALARLILRNSDSARLFMGDSTRLEVYGDFVNQFSVLTNATFDTSSTVSYDGVQQPQFMQATAATNPYGHLRTARSTKVPNGDIYVATRLSVHDTDIVMVPHRMNMWLGEANYFDHAEVIGAFRRDLAGADTQSVYRFNNEQTQMRYQVIPAELTLDVRPLTRPNAYDSTTDVYRKITVTSPGPWIATVRLGYKATDIPSTWVPETAERLMKMYNAYPVPDERAVKLTPTVPPRYDRRPILDPSGVGQPGFGYVELSGVRDSGPDNYRVDSGNDILLRASRDVLKAVASGRWSNPFTWDEAREPEPIDRVVIDGFTVHTGYVRANDNYAIAEAYPDSMATNVIIGSTPNSSLLFGSTSTFAAFSLTPNSRVALTNNRAAAALVPVSAQDTTATDIDGGLVVYRGSSFSTPNLVLTPGSTAFNGGLLQVGIP